MRYMTSNQIRETWLKFFVEHGHKIFESAPLVPKDDPTLLWINAGVAPLKKYFDGTLIPESKRITNVQKCIRTNDIENVGKTSRHHTFFEMLGNFSIGDYFKEEAINLGYELLTSEKYFNFPIEKLYFTYYTNDLVTKEAWLKLGIKADHIIPMDDNYWEIGEGPSGPNTEIFFDRGEKYDSRGVELIKDDIDNDRYIEIWNIVFSQYNATQGLKRSEYPELPNRNIDTGAGLERFATILQNTETNFETDLFLPIIKALEKITNIKYEGQMAFKVIADHLKTLVFAISDGALLSNEGRGYVLRRILRRAVKYGRDLGLNKPFLKDLVIVVVDMMKDFYPNLVDNIEIVEKVIEREEIRFLETLAEGEKHFYESIKGKTIIDGKTAFMLYDTYGFPIELTIEYGEENNLTVDLAAFNKELKKQKERSRSSRLNEESMNIQNPEYLNFKEESKYIGYETLEKKVKVIKVFKEGIVLNETPFYAASGGEISDKGTINGFEVVDVLKLPNNQNLHIVEGNFSEEEIVTAKVNQTFRLAKEQNHSATHLLHQALKDVLGSHVNQQGSLVSNEYLRFDFNHYEQISNEQILKIEQIVKEKIKAALPITTKIMNIEDAKKLGAMALFGEKYGNDVRVVNMGYSIELCGGNHLTNTKDILDFAIIQLESIGSGTYRTTASTNGLIKSTISKELSHIEDNLNNINTKLKELNDNKQYKIAIKFNSFKDILNNRELLTNARDYLHNLEKELEETKTLNILKNANSYIPENTKGKAIIKVENIDTKILKQLADVIYDKIQGETLVLINIESDGATFIVKTNGKTHAGNTIKELAKLTNGRGGGRDTIAQGGTKDLTNLDQALIAIEKVL